MRRYSLREAVAPFSRVLLERGAEVRLINGLPVPLREAGRCVPGTVGLQDGLCVEGAELIGFADREDHEGEVLLRPRVNILLTERETEAPEGA